MKRASALFGVVLGLALFGTHANATLTIGTIAASAGTGTFAADQPFVAIGKDNARARLPGEQPHVAATRGACPEYNHLSLLVRGFHFRL